MGPLHRLVYHSSVADDRVLLDSRCGAAQPWRWYVLAPLARHRCDTGVRLHGRGTFVNAWMGFMVGMAGWGYILFEIFSGEAGSVAADGEKVNQYVKSSFNTMRLLVTAGWSIYPLGYVFGYLMGAVNDDALNLVYNLADFVNKIAFCLAIWQAAKADTHEKIDKERLLA